jgi:signal recognition particle subunit SRP54
VTGVPIRFIGTGEGLDRLEPFRPEGLASRILGMGDVVGLVRDFEQVVDQAEAEQDAERLLAGRFGLEDLLKQLQMIQKLGPLREIVSKLPMFGALAEQVDERELVKVEALIRSMTPGERARPEIIDKSRASRIARGSGRRSKEVRELVGRFGQMREMMAAVGGRGGGGLLSRIPGLGRGAGLPDPSALLAQGEAKPRREPARSRSRQKDKRRQARRARKKNRRR